MGTSWIDGSFVYSTSETLVNTMRSFKNGTFRVSEGKLPPRNKERVPLFNSPPARYLGIMSPERMFSKCRIPFFCLGASDDLGTAPLALVVVSAASLALVPSHFSTVTFSDFCRFRQKNVSTSRSGSTGEPIACTVLLGCGESAQCGDGIMR